MIGVSEWPILEKVFKNILAHFVVETQPSNNHSFKIEESEMGNFIGLLFLSASIIRLNTRGHWSESFDPFGMHESQSLSLHRENICFMAQIINHLVIIK